MRPQRPGCWQNYSAWSQGEKHILIIQTIRGLCARTKERGGWRRDRVPVRCRRLWGGPGWHCSLWSPVASLWSPLCWYMSSMEWTSGGEPGDADIHFSVNAGQCGDHIHAVRSPGREGGPENIISPKCWEGLSVSRDYRVGRELSQFSIQLEGQDSESPS